MRFIPPSSAVALAGVLLLAACSSQPTNVRVEHEPPAETQRPVNKAPEAQQKQTEQRTAKQKERGERIAQLEERGIKPAPKNKKDNVDRKLAPTANRQSEQKGSYKDYAEGVIGGGKPIVLFFFATWSPKSEMDDKMLVSWYMPKDDRPMLTVYKVDMDQQKELAKEFKVTDDHTYVKLDPRGRMIDKVFSPSAQELRDFLDNAHAG